MPDTSVLLYSLCSVAHHTETLNSLSKHFISPLMAFAIVNPFFDFSHKNTLFYLLTTQIKESILPTLLFHIRELRRLYSQNFKGSECLTTLNITNLPPYNRCRCL